MRTVLTALFAILLFVLGCWTPGDIQEHLPKHRDKFPAETVFFVDKTEPRVTNALVDALKASRGGQNLKRVKLLGDVYDAAKIDSLDVVPEFRDGEIRIFTDSSDASIQ